MNYTPKNILVTGGAGFIGANFIEYYLQQHPEVLIVNLDLLTYAANLNNLNAISARAQYHFIQGNINDAALVENIFEKFAIDTVVHFAAESHVDRSIENPKQFLDTNIIGTFTLLEAAKQYWLDKNNWSATQCRFHHVSTDEVFGSLEKDAKKFTEQTPYQPRSPYSASKASSDHLVKAYHDTYNLPITLSNCSNNYGPYQHSEKLIPKTITHCLSQKPIPIYGKGDNIRDWLYVQDHCQAIEQILLSGKVGETYLVGGVCEVSNIEIVSHICQLMNELKPGRLDYQSLITYVNDRKGHDFRYAIDIQKISKELGWKPSTSLALGLEKTIQYYLNIQE